MATDQKEKDDQPWLKYTWKKPTVLVNARNNPNIGKRTGKDVKLGKNIRVNEHGLENFDDYFTDEDSESSVASFAFGPESVDRNQQEKENALGTEHRTIQKTAFKEPLRPMSPFSASSQNSDVSVASDRVPLPPPVTTAPLEQITSCTSQSQISTSIVNGAGDALGSISRSESTSSKLEPPNSALQSFRTKKRLTYSAAVSNANTPQDALGQNGTPQNSDDVENEITMDVRNKTTEIEEAVACTGNEEYANVKGEKVMGEGKDDHEERQTSPRKSARIAVTNHREDATEKTEQTVNKNVRETRHSAKVSQPGAVKIIKETNEEMEESQPGPRRSSRNRNKGNPPKAPPPQKLQKNDSKHKGTGVAKRLKQSSEKDVNKGKPSDTASNCSGDEYDFENETESTAQSKPKSKKNLQNAFDASVRAQQDVVKYRTDNKSSTTSETNTIFLQGNGEGTYSSQKQNELGENDDEVTNQKILKSDQCKENKGNVTSNDPNTQNSNNTGKQNIAEEIVESHDSMSTEEDIVPVDAHTEMDNSVCSSQVDGDFTGSQSTELKDDAALSQGDQTAQSNHSTESTKVRHTKELSQENNVSEKTLQKETEYVSDSSDDEGGGIFLSLSRKSIAIPETQSQPDDDEDDDFEMVNSPLPKKRISLQPKKSMNPKPGKAPLEPIKTQKSRKSQLKRKKTNQGFDEIESTDERGKNYNKTRKASKSESESQNESDGTDKGTGKHALRNFVFSESDNESTGVPQKGKANRKRAGKKQVSAVSESDANVKSKSGKVKKSRNNVPTNSQSDTEEHPNEGRPKKTRGRNEVDEADDIPDEEIEPKKTGRTKRQSKKANDKRKKQATDTNTKMQKNIKGRGEDKDHEESDDENVILNQSDADMPDNEHGKENDSPPREMPMPVGSSSKAVVRRSRSSLTIVSREPNAPVANILQALHTSPSEARDERQVANKGAKEYNKYTNLLGDFEEEFETSVSDNLARTIDNSVSRAISLLATPAKSPANGKFPKSVVPTETQDDVEDNFETGSLGASPQLQNDKKRRHSSSTSTAGQSSSGTNHSADKGTGDDNNDTPVAKKKKRGKSKRISLSPRRSNSRKRSLSAPSPQTFEHKRLKQLKGKDRRGSIVTSTPVVPGGRRQSVGFAVTPSPDRRNGSVESTPRSILKNSSVLPRYSVSSPLHYQNVTNSPKPTPVTKPPEKVVKIVEPEEPENPNLRRSKRARVKPLAWYAGERIDYNRRKSGAVIVGIINPAEQNKLLQEYIDPVNHNKKNKNPRRKKVQRILPPQTPRNMSIHGEVPTGCDSPSIIPVINPRGDDENYQECVRTRDAYHFRGPTGKDAAAEDQLIVSKFLTHETFSMGQLVIRPLEAKDTQIVNCTMVFYVMYGKLAVDIHRTTCLLESGDSFFVPPGNTYAIQNLRNDEAKLLFFQIKGDKKKKKKRSNSAD